jgi:hypothetical protein
MSGTQPLYRLSHETSENLRDCAKVYFLVFSSIGVTIGLIEGQRIVEELCIKEAPRVVSTVICNMVKYAVTFPFTWPRGFFQ